MTHVSTLTASVPPGLAGQRLDVIAAELFPEFSRARLQGWIKSGDLTVDAQTCKPNSKLLGGEILELLARQVEQGEWTAQAMPLDLVFEDEQLLVINKPAGLVVHPAAGNYQGTLLNGLLHHRPELAAIPRAGIVHRLDKDTTGLMVVAKTLQAQANLVAQLQARTVKRQYRAIVFGAPPGRGEISEPIGRDPRERKKMAVNPTGKEACTEFFTIRPLGPLALVELNLQTGRTHQIRVHMAHIGHPLLGDPVYCRRRLTRKQASAEQLELAGAFARQALHAGLLRLQHPASREACQWQVPLPDDMQQLIDVFGSNP